MSFAALRETDKAFNDGIRNLVQAERAATLTDYRVRNARYRQRRNADLGLSLI